jgi:hypothetical protein
MPVGPVAELVTLDPDPAALDEVGFVLGKLVVVYAGNESVTVTCLYPYDER